MGLQDVQPIFSWLSCEKQQLSRWRVSSFLSRERLLLGSARLLGELPRRHVVQLRWWGHQKIRWKSQTTKSPKTSRVSDSINRICIIIILSAFKLAFYTNGVHERAELWLLPSLWNPKQLLHLMPSSHFDESHKSMITSVCSHPDNRLWPIFPIYTPKMT